MNEATYVVPWEKLSNSPFAKSGYIYGLKQTDEHTHTYILIIIVSHDLLTEQELLQMCLQRKELLSNQDN